MGTRAVAAVAPVPPTPPRDPNASTETKRPKADSNVRLRLDRGAIRLTGGATRLHRDESGHDVALCSLATPGSSPQWLSCARRRMRPHGNVSCGSVPLPLEQV